MRITDAFESFTALVIDSAGLDLLVWDEPVAGFYIEPDIIAETKNGKLVVLVNASDSFFASQKKVWRNIEEPFEAHQIFGLGARVVSISFITPVAKNAIFRMSEQFFDDTFVLCDLLDNWQAVLDELGEYLQLHSDSYNNKREFKELLASEKKHLPAGLGELHRVLTDFFRAASDESVALPSLWEADKHRRDSMPEERTQSLEKLEFGGSHGRGIVRSSLLGADLLDVWEAAGLGVSDSAQFRQAELSDQEFSGIERGAQALEIHELASVARTITGALDVQNIHPEIVGAFRTFGAVRVRSCLASMVTYYPNLMVYVDGSRDFEMAENMVTCFRRCVAQGQSGFSQALFECSADESFLDIPSI